MHLPDWTQGVHHDGSEAYVSNPYPRKGEQVWLYLRVPKTAPLKAAFLRTTIDGESHHAKMVVVREYPAYNLWRAALTMNQPQYDYRFKLMTDEGMYILNAIGISRADSPDYYDFKLLVDYQAPHWVREQVFYQIFPDRFYNGDPSNDVQDGEWEREGAKTRRMAWGASPVPWTAGRSIDFFGGDLQGITAKLDYVQQLGVTALYLTPIFTAASNHRYDVTRYSEVDPHLGGNAALAELRAALSERRMRLMLDITPNHVGVTHDWLKAAQADPHSEEASFFFYDEAKGAYETWLGVPSLIKLNYGSQALRERMYRQPDSALRRWLQPPYAIDGWRLDVANMTGNLSMSQLDHEVWREIRPILKADNPELYLLGEYFMDGTMHTQGDELDAAMNYAGFNIPMRRWLGGEDVGVQDGQPYGDPHLLPTEALALQWRRFMAAVPYVIALQQFNQLDSHDTTRLLYVVKGDKALYKLGMAVLMAFVGVPCLYYGGEIGLSGAKDPDNRRCMPWNEAAWDMDLLAMHRRLNALRLESSALKHGGFQLLLAEGDLLAFLRESAEEKIIVAGNRGSEQVAHIPCWMAGLADGARLVDALSGAEVFVQKGQATLALAHGQAAYLRVQA
jgi:alpha-glucosidase